MELLFRSQLYWKIDIHINIFYLRHLGSKVKHLKKFVEWSVFEIWNNKKNVL